MRLVQKDQKDLFCLLMYLILFFFANSQLYNDIVYSHSHLFVVDAHINTSDSRKSIIHTHKHTRTRIPLTHNYFYLCTISGKWSTSSFVGLERVLSATRSGESRRLETIK